MNRVLVLYPIFLSFFAFSGLAGTGSEVAQAAQNPPFVCTAIWASYYGLAGIVVNFTNQLQSEMTVNVYFVWYNPFNQIVNIGSQFNASFTPGQTQSFYNAYQNSGVYYVNTFVRDLVGDALSVSCSATVTIP
jgi:hypothetical protein